MTRVLIFMLLLPPLSQAGCRSPSQSSRAVQPPLSQWTSGSACLSPATKPHSTTPLTLTQAEIEHVIGALRSRAPFSALPKVPAVGDPTDVTYQANAGRKLLTTDAFRELREEREIPRGEKGTAVDVHSMLLRRVPSARLQADGTMVVAWQTLRPVPAGSVYFGSVLPGPPIGIPRFRKHVYVGESTARGDQQSPPFSLLRLLRAKVDAPQARLRGRGTVYFRVELLDTDHGTSRAYDGSMQYRCDPRPCVAGSRFTQLPSFTLAPVVDLVTPQQVTLSWTNDVPTVAAVSVEDPNGQRRTVFSLEANQRHEVVVDNLQPNTRYRYVVAASDYRGELGLSRGAHFDTAPAQAQRFRFAVIGDSRSGVDVGEASYGGMNRYALQRHLMHAFNRRVSLILFTGDLVDGYTTSEAAYRLELRAWQRSAQPVAAYIPIYEGMGNHEALIDAWSAGWAANRATAPTAETVFASEFINPRNGPAAESVKRPPYSETVYSFDHAGVHFVVLNSNHDYRSHFERTDHPAYGRGNREGMLTLTQLRWLDSDLGQARRRGARHIFVFAHEPAFPNGGHVKDAMYWNGKLEEVSERRDAFWNILVKHRATAAFFGDEHNYSRTLIDSSVRPSFKHPIWSVISGGAGAPYYAQNKNVPWRANVKRFRTEQHFVVVEVSRHHVSLEAIGITGNIIDHVELVPATS